MDIGTAEKIASSEYLFAILFLVGLYVAYKGVSKRMNEMRLDNKEREGKIEALYDKHHVESYEREKNLMEHLNRSDEAHKQTSDTLRKVEVSLQSLDNKMQKMDVGISDIWKKIDEIDNKQC